MKALVIKGVKEIGMIEKEKPVADERFSVIKVTHAGICGSDLHLFWAVGGFAGTNYVPGHEFAGVIEETLPGSGFEVGDRVVAMEDAQEIFEGLDNGSRPAVKYIYDMSK